MPELCEVQIMTENLEKWCLGKQLQGLEIIDQKLQKTMGDASGLSHKKITKLHRRAKYSLIEAEDYTLILHYRMTGKTVLETTPRKWVRMRLFFTDGTTIAFVDPRRFGEATLIATSQLRQYFIAKNVGEDPWPIQRDAAWWEQHLGGLNQEIKIAMLRQDKIAGLGNILASEICFRAKLNPTKKASIINKEEWERIATAAFSCIEEILEEERADEIGYVNQGNTLPQSFLVYGRKGEPCSVCQQPIASFTQQSRSTYWCSVCQQA